MQTSYDIDENMKLALEHIEKAIRRRRQKDRIINDINPASGAENTGTNGVITLDDDRKKALKGALSEAVASLQTIADEREHYNDIAASVEKDHGINKKVFKKIATGVHKGKLEEEINLMEEADEVYTAISEVL
jgi:hypothetical protein